MFDMSSIQGAMGVFGGGERRPWDDDVIGSATNVTQAMQQRSQPQSWQESYAQTMAAPQQQPAPSEATQSAAEQEPAQRPPQPPAPAPSQADDMVQSTAGEVNDKLDNIEQATTALGGADGQQNNFMNSNLRKTAKKVASAVAAFYTGGLSSAAMNVGAGLVSQNNPKAGAIAGAASKAFGGGGGGFGF